MKNAFTLLQIKTPKDVVKFDWYKKKGITIIKRVAGASFFILDKIIEHQPSQCFPFHPLTHAHDVSSSLTTMHFPLFLQGLG